MWDPLWALQKVWRFHCRGCFISTGYEDTYTFCCSVESDKRASSTQCNVVWDVPHSDNWVPTDFRLRNPSASIPCDHFGTSVTCRPQSNTEFLPNLFLAPRHASETEVLRFGPRQCFIAPAPIYGWVIRIAKPPGFQNGWANLFGIQWIWGIF